MPFQSVHALSSGVIAWFTATAYTTVFLPFPGIFALSICTLNVKPSVNALFSASMQVYVGCKWALVYFRTKEIWIGVKVWEPHQWASLANDCVICPVHVPLSTKFGVALSFRWRFRANIGKPHSRRRKEEGTDLTWATELEAMLDQTLRICWWWIYVSKKQQSQSHRLVNTCHYLSICYWRDDINHGNMSQIAVNIINAIKTIAL